MVGFWVGVAMFLLVLLSHLLLKTNGGQNQQIPKGSMGWPLIGETIAYFKPHKSTSLGTFLEKHCSRYGRVFKSQITGSPTIISCDVELNMFILQNEGKLFRAFYPKSMQNLFGNPTILLLEGDDHKKLRTIIVNFISCIRSKPDFLHGIEKLTVSVLNSWEDRQHVSFCEEARTFTMSLMLKSLLNIEPEDPLTQKIIEVYHTFVRGFLSVSIAFPGTPYAKAIKARLRLSAMLKGIIEKERSRGDDWFFGEILEKGIQNIDEIVTLMLDLLLAGGYISTPGLLGLVVYFLSGAPSVLNKLKEEHEDLRMKKNGQPLTWEDYKQMEFTMNVMNEAMRCGNLTKIVHRRALQDVYFKGYLIPKGWQVIPVFSGPHLDPSLYENPTEFNPWRWNDQSAWDASKKVTFFGGGKRLCPGAELAKVETAFFLHHLVLNYRWKIKGETYPISCPYLDFKGGLLLEMEPTKYKNNPIPIPGN